jgi:hypothetical protein
MRRGDFGEIVTMHADSVIRDMHKGMERTKKNTDAEAFLDRLWEEAKAKAFDRPATFGKYGVVFDVADSTLVQAMPQCQPVVRMPRTNQHA